MDRKLAKLIERGEIAREQNNFKQAKRFLNQAHKLAVILNTKYKMPIRLLEVRRLKRLLKI